MDSSRRLDRRRLLAAGAALGLSTGLGIEARAEDAETSTLPARPFGRTGFRSTVFGLGCFPLGSLPEEEDGVRVVLRALDAGCNYLDTAPSYARGKSETRVGKALALRKDREVFVATKTHTRRAEDARRDLEGSLRRLGRERIDLVQVHALQDAADLDRILAKGGPVEALEKAREEGLVRFIGVTGHVRPSAMKLALERWSFDAVLMPLNCVDPHHASFVEDALPTAVEKKTARVAMKVFASGGLPSRGVDAAACLRFTYGLDVATAVVGCRTTDEVDQAARVAREDRALDDAEKAALLAETRPHAGTGTEWYKRTR